MNDIKLLLDRGGKKLVIVEQLKALHVATKVQQGLRDEFSR